MNTPPRKESETGLYGPVWKKINQLIDYVREISVVNGRNVRLTRTMNGTMLLGESAPEVQEATPGVIKQFRVKVVGDDSMTCVEWDGTTEGSQETILKPYLLRRTPFDGQTFSISTERIPATISVTYNYSSATKRTATSGGVVETQVIIPRFAVNDIIYAMNCEDAGDQLIDINADGRAWASIFV